MSQIDPTPVPTLYSGHGVDDECMTARVNTARPRVLTNPFVLLWLALVFLTIASVEYCVNLELLIVYYPSVASLYMIYISLVPICILLTALYKFYYGRWSEALRYSVAIMLCLPAIVAGVDCGDLVAFMTYEPLLKSEVEAVKRESPSKKNDGALASSTMAVRLTGTLIGVPDGFVYDESDQVGRMMPLQPSKRPDNWERNAVDILSCQGTADQIANKFYKITVNSDTCLLPIEAF